MAVEGLGAVMKRVKEEGLVTNLGQRDLHNPEGCGLDFRLGKIHEIVELRGFVEQPFIEADGPGGYGLRRGVNTRLLASFDPESEIQPFVIIRPGEYRLVETVETVNVPSDLMAMAYPRSTLQRLGLLLITTKTDPGYKGTLTFGLRNLGPVSVRLQMGARICNMVFYQVAGETVAYRGQHQGGRTSHEEVERQV